VLGVAAEPWLCDCEKKCSILVEAGSEAEAIDVASEMCDGAPWECTCALLRRDYEPDVLDQGLTAMRTISFKISRELLEKLDKHAETRKLTRSDVIRKAIELYLKLEDYKVQPQPRYVRLVA